MQKAPHGRDSRRGIVPWTRHKARQTLLHNWEATLWISWTKVIYIKKRRPKKYFNCLLKKIFIYQNMKNYLRKCKAESTAISQELWRTSPSTSCENWTVLHKQQGSRFRANIYLEFCLKMKNMSNTIWNFVELQQRKHCIQVYTRTCWHYDYLFHKKGKKFTACSPFLRYRRITATKELICKKNKDFTWKPRLISYLTVDLAIDECKWCFNKEIKQFNGTFNWDFDRFNSFLRMTGVGGNRE